MKVYGIANCSTIKKAMEWLKNNDHPSELHDYKKYGVTKEKLGEWLEKVDWEKLVNKKGTTWRMLPREQQQKVADKNSAIELMILKPSVIKRPVIEWGAKLLIGFDEATYKNNFNKK